MQYSALLDSGSWGRKTCPKGYPTTTATRVLGQNPGNVVTVADKMRRKRFPRPPAPTRRGPVSVTVDAKRYFCVVADDLERVSLSSPW